MTAGRAGFVQRIAFVAVALLVAASCTDGGDARPPTSEPAGTAAPTTGVADTVADLDCHDVDRDADEAAALDLDERWRTAPNLPSVGAFDRLATTGSGGRAAVKFSITDFFERPSVEWLDSNFYTLHDEWYWFRLLNGEAIAGTDVKPVDDPAIGPFETVGDVYDWAAERRDRLPLDLQFTSLDRLYSPMFYDLALDNPNDRPLALGSIIRVPPSADCSVGARWLLELEYRDEPTPAHVARYLDLVIATLPDEIGDALLWVPRSREQEITADTMLTDSLSYGDRTIRFDDLVEPGAVEVYAAGVAAGRLLLVTDDSRYSLSDAGPDDIVVVQRTPDFLPPGAALITGSPQTPLAHVNVLALNRGIPNAYLAGMVDNIELSQLGRVRAPVAVRAIGPGQLDIRVLTDEEYEQWRSRRGSEPIALPALDLTTLPLTVDLDQYEAATLTEAQLAELRPAIGGKAAGFLALAAPGTVTMPERPLAITVRAYFEHVAQLGSVIDDMVTSAPFQQSARARFILLEGPDDFVGRFESDADARYLDEFRATHRGSVLGDITDAGGLKKMISDLDVDPATLAEIERSLRDNFGELSLQQGLRFRSSSSVEDIEGFNGAGLYTSNTGFIDPTALPDPNDHDRTVERALQRTWSSYWNAEAVEERLNENVDQTSGAMAVLVHPNFDDDLELSNGVATFTLLPAGGADRVAGPVGGAAVLRLNAQFGDTSVTNPDNEPGQAPEIIELRRAEGDDTPRIDRLAPSTLTDDGRGDDARDRDGTVLNDDQLLDVWEQLEAVTVAWRDRINAELPASQRISTLTIDFEFREMAAAWPARRDGSTAVGDRIVIKQARTLEPSLRGVPDEVARLAAPAT